MGQSQLREALERNRRVRRGSLLPFLTAGFPDGETFVELLRGVAASEVTAIEIGFPYSDSIADGPIIQSSFHEALRRGHRLAETFELVGQVRSSIGCPLLAMVSYSIVHRQGHRQFMKRCATAGFSAVIVPDAPAEESQAVRECAGNEGLDWVGLSAPSTHPSRRAEIARHSTGFVYQIAAAGTTGERRELSAGLAIDVASLRAASGVPVCVGFGISTAEQVREVCRISDGAIVGSALIRRIRDAGAAGGRKAEVVGAATAFVAELMRGTVLDDA